MTTPLYNELHKKGYDDLDKVSDANSSVLLYIKNNSNDNRKIYVQHIADNSTKFDNQNPTIKINSKEDIASVCLSPSSEDKELSCDGATSSLNNVTIQGKYDLLINSKQVQSNKDIQDLKDIYNSSSYDLFIKSEDTEDASPYVDLKLKIENEGSFINLYQKLSLFSMPIKPSIKNILQLLSFKIVDNKSKTILWDFTKIKGNVCNIVAADFNLNTDSTTNKEYINLSIRFLFYCEDYSSIDFTFDNVADNLFQLDVDNNINKTFKQVNNYTYNALVKPITDGSISTNFNGKALVSTNSLSFLNILPVGFANRQSSPIPGSPINTSNITGSMVFNLCSYLLRIADVKIDKLYKLSAIFTLDNIYVKYKDGNIVRASVINDEQDISLDLSMAQEKIVKKPSQILNSSVIPFTNFYNFFDGLIDSPQWDICSTSFSGIPLVYNISNISLNSEITSIYLYNGATTFSFNTSFPEYNQVHTISSTKNIIQNLKDVDKSDFSYIQSIYPNDSVYTIDYNSITDNIIDTTNFKSYISLLKGSYPYSLKYFIINNIPNNTNNIGITLDQPYQSFITSSLVYNTKISQYLLMSTPSIYVSGLNCTISPMGAESIIIGIPYNNKQLTIQKGTSGNVPT